MIYRVLLTRPGKVDPQRTRELHPDILRSNKKIDSEGGFVVGGCITTEKDTTRPVLRQSATGITLAL